MASAVATKGLGAGNVLLTPADGPLMAAAKACGIAVGAPHDAVARGNGSSDFDLVHAHDARSHTWAAALSSVPLVVSRRVGFPVGQTFLSRWKYGRASRYLAVSEHVKRTLVEAEIPAEQDIGRVRRRRSSGEACDGVANHRSRDSRPDEGIRSGS